MNLFLCGPITNITATHGGRVEGNEINNMANSDGPNKFDMEADGGKIAGNEFDGINGKVKAKNSGEISGNKVRGGESVSSKKVWIAGLTTLAAIATAIGAYFKYR